MRLKKLHLVKHSSRIEGEGTGWANVRDVFKFHAANAQETYPNIMATIHPSSVIVA